MSLYFIYVIIPTKQLTKNIAVAIMFLPAEALFAELNAYHQDILHLHCSFRLYQVYRGYSYT